ncbi:radical SAM/SPASM domain-containing protein [Sulfoacidibacillus thermotolerans]|uniref:Radical SAM core domain-containing protein n=1 Tax=Sulfoacidibacillus thermotolerans TaxID=1765684 RepID=A0A2U3DBC7_SULT2|nr:radical SAM protein [Sulfoacidibacillus thermotolerans]PWI58562.1 hypothetical protein BM613_03350 [Sulfoacidibacillus thermotolerans]
MGTSAKLSGNLRALQTIQWELAEHAQTLTTLEARRVIDQVAAVGKVRLIISGDNPLQRRDIFSLIGYAKSREIDVSLATNGIARITREAAANAHDAGVASFALRLDSWSFPLNHLIGARWSDIRLFRAGYFLADHDVPIAIHTLVTPENAGRLEQIADLAEYVFGAATWNLMFVVPTVAALRKRMTAPGQTERILRFAYQEARQRSMKIETTNAPFYQRITIQENAKLSNDTQKKLQAAPVVHDGKGKLFIANDGEIYPDEHLALSVGNVKRGEIGEIYETNELLNELRSGDRLHGKCSECVFRNICGGSRARAFAMTGDYMGQDPLCAYGLTEAKVFSSENQVPVLQPIEH